MSFLVAEGPRDIYFTEFATPDVRTSDRALDIRSQDVQQGILTELAKIYRIEIEHRGRLPWYFKPPYYALFGRA